MKLHPIPNVVALIIRLREGCLSTATTEDNISAVQLMIETGKKMTNQQIRTSLGIAMNQVHKILHEHLAVRPDLAPWDFYLFPNLKETKTSSKSGLRTPRMQWLNMKRPSKRPLNATSPLDEGLSIKQNVQIRVSVHRQAKECVGLVSTTRLGTGLTVDGKRKLNL
ncbi:hypothetical protein EVAR_74694_1 [Eumeta japonica]|uniref:Uncharacterized protein n=1 Tax=Eumeta variegata TaxID=151549 RepID=A0A4C1YMS8_EUMVA|nr:hypothetical protein EVAR_74694_1 [Eumeta japonica]